jgi:hypothetical protein
MLSPDIGGVASRSMRGRGLRLPLQHVFGVGKRRRWPDARCGLLFSFGGASGLRRFAGRVLECVVNGGPEIDQHAQRLP